MVGHTRGLTSLAAEDPGPDSDSKPPGEQPAGAVDGHAWSLHLPWQDTPLSALPDATADLTATTERYVVLGSGLQPILTPSAPGAQQAAGHLLSERYEVQWCLLSPEESYAFVVHNGEVHQVRFVRGHVIDMHPDRHLTYLTVCGAGFDIRRVSLLLEDNIPSELPSCQACRDKRRNPHGA